MFLPCLWWKDLTDTSILVGRLKGLKLSDVGRDSKKGGITFNLWDAALGRVDIQALKGALEKDHQCPDGWEHLVASCSESLQQHAELDWLWLLAVYVHFVEEGERDCLMQLTLVPLRIAYTDVLWDWVLGEAWEQRDVPFPLQRVSPACHPLHAHQSNPSLPCLEVCPLQRGSSTRTFWMLKKIHLADRQTPFTIHLKDLTNWERETQLNNATGGSHWGKNNEARKGIKDSTQVFKL